MKAVKKILYLVMAAGLFMTTHSCKTEFENHNAASEDAVFKTAEAYPGLVLGITQHFTQNAVYEIVRGPGVVAREIAATNTYLTEPELETGNIPQENASISLLWKYLHYERGVAEKIVDNIDNVTFINDAEKAGIKAYAKFMKGMTTAYLGFYWEMATVKNDPDNKAEFKPRAEVLRAALADMNDALAILDANDGAEDYINGLVSVMFSFKDVINVYRARIALELGQYDQALAAANAVDPSALSVWTYESATSSRNPIYMHQYDPGASERWKGIENMGVNVESGDQRLDFYLGASTGIVSTTSCHFPTNFILGFWDEVDEDIPVYLPDEVKLIKAEAQARLGNLGAAVALINEVRQDTDDPFGVNAGLGPWTPASPSEQEVLDQVFYNYAMEVYLQGMRWLAHRRIYPHHLDGIDQDVPCDKQRTRNFFPYPYNEVSNNPNVPEDPSI